MKDNEWIKGFCTGLVACVVSVFVVALLTFPMTGAPQNASQGPKTTDSRAVPGSPAERWAKIEKTEAEFEIAMDDLSDAQKEAQSAYDRIREARGE